MIQLPDNILKRQEARQDSQKIRDETPSQADVFRDTFKDKQIDIENTLDSVATITDRLTLADVFDKVAKDVNQLSRYLASSSIFLIPYDIKMSKSAIEALQNRAAELEDRYLPKKKFSFKNRRDLKKGNGKTVDNVEKITDRVNNVAIPQNSYIVSDRSDETILIRHEEIENKDVMLSALKRCYIYVHGVPNTLHLVELVECKIVSGPVVTSVLAEGVTSSLCSFPCQQLRVHNTKNTDFFIHVTTRAIIEDTTGARFAPNDYSYEGFNDHFVSSGLNKSSNHWDDVDDFNWLVSNKQSPNWSTVPVDERSVLMEDLKSHFETVRPVSSV